MNPTNVKDAAAKTIQIFEGICKNLNLSHIPSIQVDPDNPATDEYALLIINDGEQYIEIENKEVRSETGMVYDAFGRIKEKRIHYTVQHEVIVHGTRYYPDGSGEPDTSDIVDDAVHSNPYNAVGDIVKLNFAWEIDNYLEAEALAESEKEADESWEEYCRDMEKNPPQDYANEYYGELTLGDGISGEPD